MAVDAKSLRCEFFLSPKGCSRGKRCRFSHDAAAPKAGQPRSAFGKGGAVPSPAPAPAPAAAAPAPAVAAPPVDVPAPVASPPSGNGGGSICKYFLEGTCTRGNKCRFPHGDGATATSPAAPPAVAAPVVTPTPPPSSAPKRKTPPDSDPLPKSKKVKSSKDKSDSKDRAAAKGDRKKKSKDAVATVEAAAMEVESPPPAVAVPLQTVPPSVPPSMPPPPAAHQLSPPAAATAAAVPTASPPTTDAARGPRAPKAAKAEKPREKAKAKSPKRQANAAKGNRATRSPSTATAAALQTPRLLGSVQATEIRRAASGAAAGASPGGSTRTGASPAAARVGGGSALAPPSAVSDDPRGVALDQLVARTVTAPAFKDSYAGCTWTPLPPGWATSDGSHASYGGSAGHPVVGLDCEMIECAPPFGSSLARVTLVALGRALRGGPQAERVILLDRLVTTAGRVVTDYKTAITGLTVDDFGPESDCLLSVEAAQAAVLEHITADTVLVGHALNHDLESLRITHTRVIDTGLIFKSPLQHQRLGLKDTVLEVLGQVCQPDGEPHNSAEDAAWALELVRHVVDTVDAAVPPASGGKYPAAVAASLQSTLSIAIPRHFGLRLQLHQLPEPATLENVKRALGIAPGTEVSHLRPIVFKPSKTGGGKLGAVVLVFSDIATVSRVFANLSTAGMKLDRDNLPQKKVFLDKGAYPGVRHFWVKAYCMHPSIRSREAPAQSAPVAIVCPSCNATVPPKAFCFECGAPLPKK